MHEITGDLFDSVLADAICITTNGFVNAQGANTMGAGCALEAKKRWPGIQMTIGSQIRHGGNDCRLLTHYAEDQMSSGIHLPVPDVWGDLREVPYHILMFPTKPAECSRDQLLPRYKDKPYGDAYEIYPGWMAQSDLDLIARSACQLGEITDQQNWKSVVLPRPGCGKGGLSWEDQVRPILADILDARFYVISPK